VAQLAPKLLVEKTQVARACPTFTAKLTINKNPACTSHTSRAYGVDVHALCVAAQRSFAKWTRASLTPVCEDRFRFCRMAAKDQRRL